MDYFTKLKLHCWIIIILMAGLVLVFLFLLPERKNETIKHNQFYDTTYASWMAPGYIETEVRATITGYSSDPAETDSRPYETASGTTVNPKTIACPREIPFDTIVEIDGQKYICEDRMNIRYTNWQFDIWFPTKDEALDFGRQYKTINIYEPN